MRMVGSTLCEGDWIVATLDRADAGTGLLILSGGNEIAVGPQRAMARLATRVAADGWPVLRFDRRGIGDSGGTNRGWRSSAPDVVAALRFFTAYTSVQRIVAFGNCDAATALILHRLPIAARVLGNPWLDLAPPDMPPPAAIRAHYRERLLDPSLWRSLLAGRIDVRKAARGLRATLGRSPDPSPLGVEIAAALRDRAVPTRIVLSARDATGIAFADAWRHRMFDRVRADIPLETIATDTHGFTTPADLAALGDILLATLAETNAARR